MRTLILAKRNAKEIMRDPLSAIFCLIFPLILFAVLMFFDKFIPAENTMFEINQLAPGICVFSYSFTMLFAAQLVSKDRTTAFLNRLFTTDIKTIEYFVGYILPMLVIGIIQTLVCYVFGAVVSAIKGEMLSIQGMLLSIFAYLPIMLVFICFGILFGSALSEKAAPGVTSIIISVSSFLSGAWMPLELMGAYETFCKFLPFYPAVRLGRTVLNWNSLTFDNFTLPLLTVMLYAVVLVPLGVFVFNKKSKSDNK